MRTTALAVGCLLAACAAAPTPPSPRPTAAVAPPVPECVCPKVAGTLPPTPAETATKNYRATERTIAPNVTSPFASAAYINSVEHADKLARKTLENLLREDGHPKPASIAAAKAALNELVTTLETPQ